MRFYFYTITITVCFSFTVCPFVHELAFYAVWCSHPIASPFTSFDGSVSCSHTYGEGLWLWRGKSPLFYLGQWRCKRDS